MIKAFLAIGLLVSFSSLSVSGRRYSDRICNCTQKDIEKWEPRFYGNTKLVQVGDMLLHEDAQNHFAGVKSNYLTEEKMRWPGTVYYFFNKTSRYTEEERNHVRYAMGRITSLIRGCLKFRELKSRPSANEKKNYIIITRGRGCNSQVGMAYYSEDGSQHMSLGDNCVKDAGVIQHEFFHALGFFHEQNRADRDEFINVDPYNIDGYTCYSYQKCSDCTFGKTKYDYKSLMHYSSSLFSCNGEYTFRRRDNGETVKYNHYPTVQDIETLADIYQCSAGIRKEYITENYDLYSIEECERRKKEGQCSSYSGGPHPWCAYTCEDITDKQEKRTPDRVNDNRGPVVSNNNNGGQDQSDSCPLWKRHQYCRFEDSVRARCPKSCRGIEKDLQENPDCFQMADLVQCKKDSFTMDSCPVTCAQLQKRIGGRETLSA